ncbi:hypothetical protein IM774_07330 [Erysipelotrichaceae bacterium RD49]|nr:hypothetical protein [Erysipelotrichaceae bacterium RD49]
MKRNLALPSCLLLALMFGGCSSASTPTSSQSESASVQAENETVQPSASNQTEIKKTTESIQPSQVHSKLELSEFETITVVDNDQCLIQITGIEEKTFMGMALNVHLENRSPETTYRFSTIAASINDIHVEDLFSESVAPGKSANDTIRFENLKSYGMDIYTDIELTFTVRDDNDFMANPIAQETVHVYPYGQENATRFERQSQSNDQMIVDNDYAKVIVTGYEPDGTFGYEVNLFIENKSDRNLMFSVDGTSVNDMMVDPFWAESIEPHKMGFDTIRFSKSNLEENQIEQVDKIEFSFVIHDADDWMADDYFNEVITLYPNKKN